jgi:hypothetical protein
MPDPDYKTLCAELTNELQGYKVAHPMHCRALLNRARAALAQPKPPSLKEQALALVEQHEEGWRPSPKDWDTIRRALEALDD